MAKITIEKKEKLVRANVYITEKQLAFVDKFSKKTNKNHSQIVRNMLASAIRRMG